MATHCARFVLPCLAYNDCFARYMDVVVNSAPINSTYIGRELGVPRPLSWIGGPWIPTFLEARLACSDAHCGTNYIWDATPSELGTDSSGGGTTPTPMMSTGPAAATTAPAITPTASPTATPPLSVTVIGCMLNECALEAGPEWLVCLEQTACLTELDAAVRGSEAQGMVPSGGDPRIRAVLACADARCGTSFFPPPPTASSSAMSTMSPVPSPTTVSPDPAPASTLWLRLRLLPARSVAVLWCVCAVSF